MLKEVRVGMRKGRKGNVRYTAKDNNKENLRLVSKKKKSYIVNTRIRERERHV